MLSIQKLDIFKNTISILNILGTICSSETVAPLAGQPRPSSASGTSHVHPYISVQDQLPQHQTDHRCVSITIISTTSEGTDSIFLSCTDNEVIYRADSTKATMCPCVTEEPDKFCCLAGTSNWADSWRIYFL